MRTALSQRSWRSLATKTAATPQLLRQRRFPLTSMLQTTPSVMSNCCFGSRRNSSGSSTLPSTAAEGLGSGAHGRRQKGHGRKPWSRLWWGAGLLLGVGGAALSVSATLAAPGSLLSFKPLQPQGEDGSSNWGDTLLTLKLVAKLLRCAGSANVLAVLGGV